MAAAALNVQSSDNTSGNKNEEKLFLGTLHFFFEKEHFSPETPQDSHQVSSGLSIS